MKKVALISLGCAKNLVDSENILGLLLKNHYEIVSNKESSKCREVVIFNRKFVIKKSRCKINSENYKAYMILELFNEMGVDEVIPSRAKKIISNYHSLWRRNNERCAKNVLK